ncbi:MAG: response regulator [Candidatus Heimdallarchaeota archaeon]|nr:response regulator [Candidatus Heimdallarchaeota archaeon]MCK5143913.1 response regulator [Candidatus Heimdallarchaeota archaeon]
MNSIYQNTTGTKIDQKKKQNEEIRVLHVDDDEAILYMSKAYIEKIGEGRIIVDSLQDPTLALKVLKEGTFDVIVSDYRMSKIDGPKLVDVLEEAGFSIPIIMFTGGGRDEDFENILNSGVDYYIKKGINVKSQFKELVDVILELYRQREIINSFLECEQRYIQLINRTKPV